MARTKTRPPATEEITLECIQRMCPSCEGPLWGDYANHRSVSTLTGVFRIKLKVRRCANAECERYHKPYRPEEEGRWALPHHEFGMDVISLVGSLRYRRHCSVSEIHEELSERGMEISPRSVINLLDRYDEVLSLKLGDDQRLQEITQSQGCVILAIDGMQPDVGHEVLWVLRDCLSGEVLLAKTILSSRGEDLSALLEAVVDNLEVPVVAVISDGQSSIRKAVKESMPETPHGLCHYHYLREAARPIYEADRNAKKELKKRMRGIRPLERRVEDREDPEARIIQGYCNAVRSAITDDGRPPLDAAGLKLHHRVTQIHQSLERLEKRGPFPGS